MGVQISSIIPREKIDLKDLSGKEIAIDAYNILFQFLSIIRQRNTGEPLKDSKGRVTSHLSGLFYRTIKLLENGIKPIYIFDGEPPKFKEKTVEERRVIREEAKKKWEEAVRLGKKKEIMIHAQAASKLTDEMSEESKKVLSAMGIPCIQAPSEGEAQACHLVKEKKAYAVGSQDYDSLLFGAPRLVRNLSITGRKKLPRRRKWIEVKPEIIELKGVLSHLEINREQLVTLGILVGTDYNQGGVKGIGPKTALKLVKGNKNLDRVLGKVKWEFDVDAHEIYDFFLNPPISREYEVKWSEPDRDEIFELMVEEHDFSRKRVEKAVDKLLEVKRVGPQSSLEKWLEK